LSHHAQQAAIAWHASIIIYENKLLSGRTVTLQAGLVNKKFKRANDVLPYWKAEFALHAKWMGDD
jgi:hypothetical protein